MGLVEGGNSGVLRTAFQELLGVLSVSMVEGGHDYVQLLTLIPQDLEEALRFHVLASPESKILDQIHVFFVAWCP